MRPRISIRGCVRPSVGRSVGRSVTRYFLMMRKWPKWCNKLGKVLVTLCDASLGNSRQLWATLGQLRDASMGQLLALFRFIQIGQKNWTCSRPAKKEKKCRVVLSEFAFFIKMKSFLQARHI